VKLLWFIYNFENLHWWDSVEARR